VAEEDPTPQADEFQLPQEYQGKTTQELYNEILNQRSQLQARDEQLAVFEPYGGPSAVVQGYNTLYQRYAADNAQAQQAQPDQTQAQPNPSQNQAQPQAEYADWEYLTPQQQADKISQQVAKTAQAYVQNLAQDYASQFRQAQEQMVKQQRTEWDIYRRALEVKLKNPNVDTERLLQEMVGMATGDTSNLMDLALKNLTADADAEQRAQQLYEAKLADLEQQRANEAMQVLSGNPNGPLPLAKDENAPKTVREENAMIAKKLVEDGTLTPGHFVP
jgi:hypothetical protein